MNTNFNVMPTKTNNWMTYGVLFGMLALAVVIIFTPDVSFAGNSDFTDFENVFKSIEGFITGPVGKIIAVSGMICCGIVYIFARQDLSEGFKMLLQVCFGICFIAFASNVVTGIFKMEGALI